MLHVFAITSEPRLADSLKRFYDHRLDPTVTQGGDESSRNGYTFSRILFSEDRVRARRPVHTFRWISDEIEHEVQRRGTLADLNETVAVLDVCDEKLSDLRTLSTIRHDIGSWPVVASMLILAFPEIHWLLHTPYSSVGGVSFEASHLLNASSFPDKHGLMLGPRGFSSLLDPAGLRDGIRDATAQTPNDEGQPAADHIPLRDQEAVAIDEEKAHAYFNAYAAYRFGYRACPVSNWQTMQHTLGPDESSEDNGSLFNSHLLLEDLYLGFPDRGRNNPLSNLEEREEQLPGLRSENLQHRMIITVGHSGTDRTRANWRKNRTHLRNLKLDALASGDRLYVKMLYKPLSGIFRLWEDIGKLRRDGTPRLPEGFEWPPEPSVSSEGHSAPGRLLTIAERLIDRSKAILDKASSVPEAVCAATLALEAKEILADKTPTTALDALALQHRAEINAESMFQGVEFNLDVENRLRDIKREVEAVARWFSGRRRKRVKINARLTIVEDLAREFSELDQFEEERKCRAEARRLYFDFWAHQSPWRLFFLPLLRYISFSLRSLPGFLALVLFWILLFGVGWELLEPTVNVGAADPNVRDRGFWEAFSASTVYFFTLSPPGSYWEEAGSQVLWNIVLIFQSIVSLSHLGLLVSHIYLIVSRR